MNSFFMTGATPSCLPPLPLPRREIAFVVDDIEGWQDLSGRLARHAGLELVKLDHQGDALQQMDSHLQARAGVQAIHVLSHGAPGELSLGQTRVDVSALAGQAGGLQGITQALAGRGELFLYGCSLAEGVRGRDFVDALAQRTGARVHASASPTGSAELGGNWTLEIEAPGRGTGQSMSSSLGADALLDSWQGLLATITGTAGNDTLTGSGDDDSISGLGGRDLIDAGAGADSVNAGGGNDNITAVWEVFPLDIINGAGGFDKFTLDASASTYGLEWASQNASTSVILAAQYDSAMQDIAALLAQAGELRVIPNAYGDEQDWIYGGASISSIEDFNALGGMGNDLYVALGSQGSFDGADGIDTFYADWSSAVNDIELHNPASGSSTGNGNGYRLTDVERLLVNTGSGDDSVSLIWRPYSPVGVVNLGTGFDSLTLTDDGVIGAGMEWASQNASTSEILVAGADSSAQQIAAVLAQIGELRVIPLSSGTDEDWAYGGTSISGVDDFNVLASYNHDLYVALGSQGSFDGGDGEDTFYADWSSASTDISLDNLSTGTSSANGYSLSNVERLVISTGAGNDHLGNADHDTDDYLDGGAGGDTFLGGAGRDTLIGGTGSDSLDGGVDTDEMTGGDGSDVYYVDDSQDVVLETNADDSTGGTDAVFSSLGEYTLGANIEDGRIVSAGVADLTGNSLDNLFYAGDGDNVLNGAAGNDTVSYQFAGSAVTVGLQTGGQNTGGSGLDSLISINNLVGSNYNDTLSGSSANNLLDGGAGVDTVSYAGVGSAVVARLNTGSASGTSSGNDTLTGVENLVGSSYNDTLVGHGGANVLTGGAGDDVLNGLGGADTMAGGNGSDVYYVNRSDDIVTETNDSIVTGGYDKVYSYLAAYTLSANVEKGRIVSTGTASLTGNELDNILYAGLGNNLLDGAGGTDTVSYSHVTSAVSVSLDLGGAQATGGSGSDTLVNIENITGSRYNDVLTGNDQANVLNGVTGADSMSGGDGSDRYYIEDAGDLVTETNASAAGGVDTVYSYLATYTLGSNLENGRVVVSTAADLTGNSLDNLIYAGAGNNVLDGLGGTDTVSYLHAQSGVNASLALTGAQTTGGSGSDTLANFENLSGSRYGDTLRGNSAANLLDGLDGDDRLIAGAGADTLLGGVGQDTLTGGSGRDVLSGGADSDVFDYNALSETSVNSASWDVITDFLRGQDLIDLSSLDADTGTGDDDAFIAVIDGAASFTAAGQLKFSGGVLYGNTDADATAEFAIELTGVATLDLADFIL
ncbi:MAG: DUF4347 domain-containing protein [Pseudomonadota bacterium]